MEENLESFQLLQNSIFVRRLLEMIGQMKTYYDDYSCATLFHTIQTRRRYGWLRMAFPGVRLFRTPIWCPSGGWRHARGREHCRGEPGSAPLGGYALNSAKAEDNSIVDEPGEG